MNNNNSPKTINKDEAIYYPEDKDWANFTVNLHDGWADDVSLVYPDESWKPDDDELTRVEIDDLEASETADEEDVDSTKAKSKLISKFSIFLIIWAVLASVVIGILLVSYYDYLERYQAAYDASRPLTVATNCMDWFIQKDAESIYSSLTVLPPVNDYENDLSVKTYIANNSVSENLVCIKTDNYTDEVPEYNILANDTLLSTIVLRTTEGETDEYGFPIWYISYFDFAFDQTFDVKLTAPYDALVYINDGLITDDYEYDNFNGKVTYLIKDFYSLPGIAAFDKDGNSLTVYYDETTECYSVE